MLTPIGTFATSLNDSIVGTVLLPIFVLALLFVGFGFMLGNHEHSKQRAQWVFAGAGIGLLAKTLATAFAGGFPH